MRTRFRSGLSAGAVAMLLGVAQPSAHAIDWSSADWGGYSPDFLSWSIQHDMIQRDIMNRTHENEEAVSGKAGKKGKGADKDADKEGAIPPREQWTDTPYEYRHSSSVNESVRKEYLGRLEADLRKSGRLRPDDRSQLQQLRQIDIPALAAKELRAMGYEPHSVATAMTYWLVTNYGIATGRSMSGVSSNRLLEQLQASMRENGELQGMGNAKKQRMAEGLLWTAALQYMAYDEARSGTAGFSTDDLAASARKNLKEHGIDIDRLAITDDGLVLQ